MKILQLKNVTQRSINLLGKAIVEIQGIKELIFKIGIPDMIKNIFAAIEAMLRAVIYLLILLMGLALAGLGAYAILFLALRIGQFLYTLIFQERWL